ncbi:hypothetical protein BX600DRAFT_464620 [Xylariales sp. PMI_506]|nr:hypothetical protein BX600DRAFT_464620 [Xylariales sp. PMI_506]
MTVCWSAMTCACSLFSVMASPTAKRRPSRAYPSSNSRPISAPDRWSAPPMSSQLLQSSSSS